MCYIYYCISLSFIVLYTIQLVCFGKEEVVSSSLINSSKKDVL